MDNPLFNSKPLLNGTCEWCGVDIDPLNSTCSLRCEAQLRRLEAAQGRIIIRAVKRWRLGPNHAARNEMLAELTDKTTRFLRQDRLRREDAQQARRQAVKDAEMAEPRKAADAQAKAAEKSAAKTPKES